MNFITLKYHHSDFFINYINYNFIYVFDFFSKLMCYSNMFITLINNYYPYTQHSINESNISFVSADVKSKMYIWILFEEEEK